MHGPSPAWISYRSTSAAAWLDAAIISSGPSPSASMIPAAEAPATAAQSAHSWLSVPTMS
jgi:hypothetical protein